MKEKKLNKNRIKLTAPDTKTLFFIFLSFLAYAGFSVLLFKVTAGYPKLIDKYYCQFLFKYINLPGKLLTSLFPFSIFEISVIALILFILIYFALSARRTIKKFIKKEKHPYIPFLRFILTIGIIGAYTVSIFIFHGGLSYNSTTFAEKSGYVLSESSTAELKELCIYLGEEAGKVRRQLPEDENGVISPDISVYELSDRAKAGFKVIEDTYPFLGGFYPDAKPVMTSVLMCYTNITGIYPYLIPESLVNYKTPITSLPATICHEMAHQRCVAREDEANYIAFLACVNNPDPLFQYSGYYLALEYAMDSLYAYDGEAAAEIASSLDSGIARDRRASREFWQQFETPNDIVATISENVNNSYLETLRVEDGTHSYGRMVDLLLAAQKAKKESKN